MTTMSARVVNVAVVVEMKPTVERQMSGPYPLDLLGGIGDPDRIALTAQR